MTFYLYSSVKLTLTVNSLKLAT